MRIIKLSILVIFLFSFIDKAKSQDILISKSFNLFDTLETNSDSFIKTETVKRADPCSDFSISLIKTPEICGLGDGSARVIITGGTPPYTINWIGSGIANGTYYNSLRAMGAYEINVRDNNACFKGFKFVVPELPSNMQINPVINHVLCNPPNGSITLNVTNGTPPYTYLWSNGATTHSINNLYPGIYSVRIKDSRNCEKLFSGLKVQSQVNSILINSSTQQANCNQNNGSISITVRGGRAPYTYLWSNGVTTQNLNNVAAGIYSVLVKDANGCEEIRNFTVSQAASTLAITVNSQMTDCSQDNGSINTNVSGGLAPYTFLWSNGETSANITGLGIGTYNVTVKDANGCTASESGIVINQQSPNIIIDPVTTPSFCLANNGSINISISGNGTSPFNYLWSNGATTQNISSVSSGIYSVIVTDANGCSKKLSGIEIIQNESTILISSNTTPTLCSANNGSINLTVSGNGSSPYTYRWSNGATTQNISGLAIGNYGVTVKDANGCYETKNGISISESTANIIIEPAITPSKCEANNGSISLVTFGGTAPYTYVWSIGVTTKNLTNLSSGRYSVNVTDANGCISSLNNIDVSLEEVNLDVNLGDDQNICRGQNIRLNAGNFHSYLWQDNSTSSSFNVTSAGQYSVRVKDNIGCKGFDTVHITSNCPGNYYFPTAFTPNGDNVNDYFGMLGDLSWIRNYELIIYTRWGQKVFITKDPLEKWDGTYNGKTIISQTCVWVASFTINNRLPQIEKGTITIIR